MKSSLLASAALLAACAGDPSGAKARAPHSPAKDASIGTSSEKGAISPSHGVPHTGNLVEVALSPDGSAAVTRDQTGGLRYWASLDGAHEPIRIPGSLANLDLRRASEDAWNVVGIDTAGAARLLRIDSSGRSQEILATPPRPKAIDAIALGGGKIAVIGSDHVVRIWDDKRIVATQGEFGFRASQLWLSKSGTLVAAAATVDDEETTVDVRFLRQSGGRLTAATSKEITFAVGRKQAPTELRMSPAGSRLSLFAKHLKSGRWQLLVAHVGSGAVQDLEIKRAGTQKPGGGFVGENRFIADAGTELVDISLKGTMEITRQLRGPATRLSPTTSVVRGHTVAAGAGDHLFVTNTEEGDEGYLGYGGIENNIQALSPSGKRIAFRDVESQLLAIYDLGSRKSMLVAGERMPTQLYFYDEDRVLATFSGTQLLVMIDTETGKRISEYRLDDLNIDIREDLLLAGSKGDLLELSPAGFTRIGKVPSANSARLVPHQGEWAVLATSTSDGKARLVTVADIRARLTAKQFQALPVAPFALKGSERIDERGRIYAVKNGNINRTRQDGTTTMTYEVPKRLGAQFYRQASTDARVVGSAHAGTGGMYLLVFDADTGRRLWSTTGVNGTMAWTKDSSAALLSAPHRGGLSVVDGTSGRPLHTVCGHQFKKRPVPPAHRTISTGGRPNVCSQ